MHTPAEQTTHTNTERAKAQRCLIVEAVVATLARATSSCRVHHPLAHMWICECEHTHFTAQAERVLAEFLVKQDLTMAAAASTASFTI